MGPAIWGLYGDESLPGNFGQDLRFLDLKGTLHRFTTARRIPTFALWRVMSDSVVRALSEISQRQRDLEDRSSHVMDDSHSEQYAADMRQVALDLLDIARYLGVHLYR